MDALDRLKNMDGTLDRELSAEFAKENDVKVIDVLTAIHVFHEAAGCGHYSIRLFADGSGEALDRMGRTVFAFHRLPQLVRKAEKLIEKHNIKWTD